MSFLMPSSINELIKLVVLDIPAIAKWSAFAIIISTYYYTLAKISLFIWSWVDYQIAFSLRRLGLSPPVFQYFIGDALTTTPGYVRRAGLFFSAGTICWEVVRNFMVPPSSSTLGWFVTNWYSLLKFAWG